MITAQGRYNANLEECSLTDETLDLLSRNHQFESHKPQSHCRLTWLLILRPVGLVEARVSWSEHLY
jgi:hypothetical protein